MSRWSYVQSSRSECRSTNFPHFSTIHNSAFRQLIGLNFSLTDHLMPIREAKFHCQSADISLDVCKARQKTFLFNCLQPHLMYFILILRS